MAKETRTQRTREEKLKIVAYKQTHGTEAMTAKYGVHPTQVRRWERGNALGRMGGHPRSEEVAKEFGHTRGNGAEPVTDKRVKVALLHLERWKNGQRAHIRRGGVDNSYDLEAEHAYRTLRGEE